jgi:AcrR family transcriptional regulator
MVDLSLTLFSVWGNDILPMVKTQARPLATRPRGRRPAGSGARDAILDAAREQFGALGYRGTTLRRVGEAADVDPRLVLHYFGSKQQLFIESVRLPVDPEELVSNLFQAGTAGIGHRVARMLLSILDDEESRQAIVGIIRAAASEAEAAQLIRQLLTTRLLTPLAEHIGRDRPELRASLMASQVVGLAMARHVVALEPLSSVSREQLIAAIAPGFDHYLAGDLSAEDATSFTSAP